MFKLKKDLHSESWDIGFWNFGTNSVKIAAYSLLTGWKRASTHYPKIGEFVSPPGKNLMPVDSPPKKFYPSHYITISML